MSRPSPPTLLNATHATWQPKKKRTFHMLPVLGEDRSSWEQTQLALIAKDHYLLNSFQALKYTEGKFHKPIESNR